MSTPTTTMSKAKPVESPYVNVSFPQRGDDGLSSAFTEMSLQNSSPRPAERLQKNVSMNREKRQDEKEPKANCDYVNVNIGSRAPIDGEATTWQTRQWNLHQYRYPPVVPGQKRTGCGTEQLYHNIPVPDDRKLRKPQIVDPLEKQRHEMAVRNGLSSNFSLPRKQSPVESIDPSSVYYNVSACTQNHLDSSNYSNLSSFPSTGLTFSDGRSPVTTPIPGPLAQHSFLDDRLPVFDAQETDLILNSDSGRENHEYVNLSNQNGHNSNNAGFYRQTVEPNCVKHPTHPIAPGHQGFIGFQPPRQQRYSESQSPASQHSFSQSNSPLNQPGYSVPHSPPTLQSYAISQPMFSPHSQAAYSPAASNHSYQLTPSPDATLTCMSSPVSSQNVPSPYSSNTGASSPDEFTLYPSDPSKVPDFGCYQQEQLTSLTTDLQSLNDIRLESFQTFSKGPVQGDGYPANASRQGSSYSNCTPQMHSQSHNATRIYAENNLNRGFLAAHNDEHGVLVGPLSEMYAGPMGTPLSEMHAGPIGTPLSEMHAGPMGTPVRMHGGPMIGHSHIRHSHIRGPVNSANQPDVKPAAPNGKMAIPAMPRQVKPAPPPTVLILIPQPQTKKYPALAPKPPTEEAAAKETKTKVKAKAKKTPKSKCDNKNSGPSRGGPPNVKAELISAKAMVSVAPDDELLSSKPNGETVLYTAIILKKQAVILAILEAMKTRPQLRALIEMTNSKQQTPLFLSVMTGQTWLVEILVKMGAECNTQCQYEACEGQLEYLSPLHYASRHGDRCLKELNAILASPKTDVNDPNRSGMTPLHMALWHNGHVDTKTKKPIDSRAVVKALLEAGAQAHTTHNNSGKTALHYAVDNGSLELTRLILESNCQLDTLINMTNYEHRTALHLAVSLRTISEENQIDLVKYLISKGANKNSKDNDKKTPKELISPTRSKMLVIFDEPTTPSSSYCGSDDDSYIYH